MLKRIIIFLSCLPIFLAFASLTYAYAPDFNVTALDLNSGTYTIDPSSLPSNSSLICQFPSLQNVDTSVIYNLNVTSCGQPYSQKTTYFSPTSIPDGRYILRIDGGDPTPGFNLSQTVNISSGIMTSNVTPTFTTSYTLTSLNLNTGAFTLDPSTMTSTDYACQIVKLKPINSLVSYNLNVTNCQESKFQPTTFFNNPKSLPDGKYELVFSSAVGAPVISQDFILSAGIASLNGTSFDLDVPLLKQTSDPWQAQEYDSAHLWNPSDMTINSWGCALTSAVMILQYYGIYTMPGTNFMPLTPGTLNDWLKTQPDGYVGTGWVNWLALSRFSKLAASYLGLLPFDALEYTRISGADKTQLTDDLNNNIPDILEEPGHFIVAKGTNGNAFDINDPYFNFTTLDNTRYNNSFLSIGEFKPSKTDLSYIMITTDPNTSITVKNQQGDTVGSSLVQSPITDPVDGVSTNSPIKIYYLPKPDSGTYTISETSQTGHFQITSYLYDTAGDPRIQAINGLDNNSFVLSFDKTNYNNSSISKIITFESTLQDISIAQNLKLIDNGLATSLTELLKNTQKLYGKNSTTAKTLLNNGIKSLDDHQTQTKIITTDIYAMLRSDFITLANSF